METLKQMLNIPENHQLNIEVKLPDNFPSGPAEVLLVFASKAASLEKTGANLQGLLELSGSLKNSSHFVGDPLTIQKELRNEWQK